MTHHHHSSLTGIVIVADSFGLNFDVLNLKKHAYTDVHKILFDVGYIGKFILGMHTNSCVQ